MTRFASRLALACLAACLAPRDGQAAFTYTTAFSYDNGADTDVVNFGQGAYAVNNLNAPGVLEGSGGMISLGRQSIYPTQGVPFSFQTTAGNPALTLTITITDTGTGKSGRIKLKDNIAGNFANGDADSTNPGNPDPNSVNIGSGFDFNDPSNPSDVNQSITLDGVTFSLAGTGFFSPFVGIFDPNAPDFSARSSSVLMANLTISPSVGAVPEPSSFALVTLGGGLLLSYRLRGRRRAA